MKEKIEHINEAIKKELSLIIAKEIDLLPGILPTITATKTSDDGGECKVFISVFPEKSAADVLRILDSQAGNLQGFLNKRIRTKWVPRIRFVEDEKLEKAQKIDQLLQKIEKEERI